MFPKRAITNIAFVCLLISLAATSPALAGTVIFVDASKPYGGDGSSWANAYRYLQDALSAAWASGGTITEVWVKKGTYKPDLGLGFTPGDRNATFSLISGVAIRGGFAASEDPATFDLSTRDFVANETILGGDLSGNDQPNFVGYSENSYHVVTGGSVTPTTVMDGLTVSGGYANGSGLPNSGGGGLYNSGGSPVLTNCTFRRNRASTGGGMYNTGSASPALISCTFIGNSASSSGGGGVYNASGTLRVVNSTFAGNSATSGAGGGIYAVGGSQELTNCILWDNAASSSSQMNPWHAATVSYSCVQSGWSGAGTANISIDPELLSIAGGNLRLRQGSPCIDAGNNAAVPIGTTTDLAGNPRFTDDPDTPDCQYMPGTCGTPPTVDMGAYEYQPGPARCLYVNRAATSTGDGLTWGTAYQHLQDALAATQADPAVTEIWVARGIYKPDQGEGQTAGNRGATFTLVNGVAIRGGFAGTEDPATFDLSTRDFVANESVLSGDLNGDDNNNVHWDEPTRQDNSYHVVYTQGAGPATFLDGLSVSGATAQGVYIRNGGPALLNCVFRENTTGSQGAAVYVDEDSNTWTITFSGCTFLRNHAGSKGAALFSRYADIDLAECAFSANLSYWGGAIYLESGSHTLTECAFSSNLAWRQGGAIYFAGATASLSDCLLDGNEAISETSQTGEGGAIYTSVPLTINRVRFAENWACNQGGAVYTSANSMTATDSVFESNCTWYVGGGAVSGSLSATNCTFSNNAAWYGAGGAVHSGRDFIDCRFTGNFAGAQGGGLYSCGTLTRCALSDNCSFLEGGGLADCNSVKDCVFRRNTAGSGGAVYTRSVCRLSNSLFLANTAVESGGAIRCFGSSVAPTITNCTFSGNAASEGGVMYNSETTAKPAVFNSILWENGAAPVVGGQSLVAYSCVQGGFIGTHNISVPPEFVDALGPDGEAGTDDDDLRLQPTSPCIDAGDNNLALQVGLLLDLDGNPRFTENASIPDTGNGLPPIIDMGAYEWSLPQDGDDDGVPDASDQCPGTIPGATVDANGCPAVIPGDFNRDGDVDAEDLDQFETCATAPGIAQTDGACEKAKLDGDNDVDQSDFALFQRCLSGENAPGDSDCAN